jgi:hypothetical protein
VMYDIGMLAELEENKHELRRHFRKEAGEPPEGPFILDVTAPADSSYTNMRR